MAEPDAGPERDDSSEEEGRQRKRARKKRKSRRGKKPDGKRRADLISAIDHPLRRRILRLLDDRDEPLSPVQIAAALGVSLSTTAYHVRILAKLRAVVRAGRKQVRGALQRFYRSTIEDDPPVEALLEETREVDDDDSSGEKRKGK